MEEKTEGKFLMVGSSKPNPLNRRKLGAFLSLSLTKK